MRNVWYCCLTTIRYLIKKKRGIKLYERSKTHFRIHIRIEFFFNLSHFFPSPLQWPSTVLLMIVVISCCGRPISAHQAPNSYTGNLIYSFFVCVCRFDAEWFFCLIDRWGDWNRDNLNRCRWGAEIVEKYELKFLSFMICSRCSAYIITLTRVNRDDGEKQNSKCNFLTESSRG